MSETIRVRNENAHLVGQKFNPIEKFAMLAFQSLALSFPVMHATLEELSLGFPLRDRRVSKHCEVQHKTLTMPSIRPTSSSSLLNASLTLLVCSSTYRAYSVEFASSSDNRVIIVRKIDSPGLIIGTV